MASNIVLYLIFFICHACPAVFQAKYTKHIHSHQHLMGPALMAGGTHAENGVPSPQIFHFNHCMQPQSSRCQSWCIVGFILVRWLDRQALDSLHWLRHRDSFHLSYRQGEVTSQNLRPRYDRRFAGITWHNVWR